MRRFTHTDGIFYEMLTRFNYQFPHPIDRLSSDYFPGYFERCSVIDCLFAKQSTHTHIHTEGQRTKQLCAQFREQCGRESDDARNR